MLLFSFFFLRLNQQRMISPFWLLLCVHWLLFRKCLWLAAVLPVSTLSSEKVFAFNDTCLVAVLAAGMPSLP